jgi:hypothetical protein
MDTIIATGMHRSGTSVMGTLLNKAITHSVTLYEPMNLKLGCKGVPYWYPYLPAEGGDAGLETLCRRIVELTCRYKWCGAADGEARAKTLLRCLGGSKGTRSWISAKLRSAFTKEPALIVKDPFSILLLGRFVQESGVKAVVTVRHPVAICQSIERQGWKFNLSNLAQQSLLQRDYPELVDFSDYRSAAEDFDVQVGLLWRVLYGVTFDLSRKYPDNILLVRHEDFSSDPFQVMEHILSFLGVTPDIRYHAYLQKISGGERIDPRRNAVHDFVRNSASLATAWQAQAQKPESRRLESLVADVYYRLYKDWLTV